MTAIPISGSFVAYTGDINVVYSIDTTPALPPGTAASAPVAKLTNTATGAAHPEMVPGCAMGTGNSVMFTLTGLAVGGYYLEIGVYPMPPGATGELVWAAPLVVSVPL